MRAKWPGLAVAGVLSAGYLCYPYATLYWLSAAVHAADAKALTPLVDWYAVREGFKEDICDLVLDESSGTRPGNELPPFGESFVRAIASNTVDQSVTPEAVVMMARSAAEGHQTDARVEWAFFENPTSFSVNVRAAGAEEPIRVVLELQRLRWRVRRVWLPGSLLERAGFGT